MPLPNSVNELQQLPKFEQNFIKILVTEHIIGKVTDFHPATLLKNELYGRCFMFHETYCFATTLHGKPYFLFPDVLKRWSFQNGLRRHMIFLVLSGKMVFFPKKMIFFLWAESERRPFSGYRWKHDALPSEEKREAWYIGTKFRLSLNLFGWRYSTMNNFQYFVPFSPQEPCLGAYLRVKNGNHLFIRG